MVTLIGGVVALVVGIFALLGWWGNFLIILKGSIPLMLIMGGALAAYLGMEEIKEEKNPDTPTENTEDLKHEVETLKEELKGLKEEKQTVQEDESTE